MKKFFGIFLLLFLSISAFAQTQIQGTIVDEDTNEPLVGVTIFNPKTNAGTSTSLDGSFLFKTSADVSELHISYIGYKSKTVSVNISQPNLGVIKLKNEAIGLKDVVVTSSIAIRRKTPVALSVIEPLTIENKISVKEFPEILKSTPGVYATKQGGGFGDSRINLRGFESANIAVMINGVPMNDMEWGGVYWSNWAGLSDVTRSMQVQRGLGASKVAAPSLGGSINVVTRSTDAKKGGAISYGIGNDGYQKIGFSVSTGLINNWAITLLGAKTSSNGYIQGTEFESFSYFLNISKLINENHQLSFTAFGAPQWHNQRNNGGISNPGDKLTIEEWQKQPLKYRYNPSYGFGINGERKASSYNVYHKPQISLNHFWTINEKSSLSTALYMSIGNGGGYSGQGYDSNERSKWYGASGGVPNTYFRAANGTFAYDSIYRYNAANKTAGGKMVMSNSINKHLWYGALSTFNTEFGEYVDFYGGLDLRYYKGIHTNEIVDMYGSDFFIDNTSRPLVSNTDWRRKKLGVGDVVYRDYDGFVMSEGIFGQAEYNRDALSAFISLSASNTSYWRYDRFYYDADKARSETVHFFGYSAKAGANYNIDSKHNVFGNFGVISRAPFFSGGAFLQSTTSNVTNPNAVNEKALSAELGYGFRSRFFAANVNLYTTQWRDKTLIRAVNDNSPESLVANMQGVNALHQGVEVDFNSKPIENLEVTGMFSLGSWNWQNNATGYLYNRQGQPVDGIGNVVEMLSPQHVKLDVNLKGIHVGNSAQTTAALGVNYQILKGFRVGLDGNYYGRNYANFNISSVGTSLDPLNFSQPWMMPDAVTFDLSANYRFKMGDFDASLVGNIDNLFNNEYISDAYDGGPGDAVTPQWKKATVFYGFGRTWSLSLKLKF